MTVLTNLEVTGILCSFRLVRERTVGKEIPESLRLGFWVLRKVFSEVVSEDNTPGSFNRGDIAVYFC